MVGHTAQCSQLGRPDTGWHLHHSFATSSSSAPSTMPRISFATRPRPLLTIITPSPVPFVWCPTSLLLRPSSTLRTAMTTPTEPVTFRMQEQRRKQCFLGGTVVIVVVVPGRLFSYIHIWFITTACRFQECAVCVCWTFWFSATHQNENKNTTQ